MINRVQHVKGSRDGWMVAKIVTDDLQFHIRLDGLGSHVECLDHRNYNEREPVEIIVEPNRISILNHGCPDRFIPLDVERKAKRSVAEKLKIPAKTAEKYISRFCIGGQLKHLAHDSYGKP